MTDQILFWFETGALVLVAIATTRRFRHVRGFRFIVYAFMFFVVLKLAEFWTLFFFVIKPHSSQTFGNVLKGRLDMAIVSLTAIAFAFALYYLGGKPASSFRNWIASEESRNTEGLPSSS